MDLTKYQHIKIKDFIGTWSAYDFYTDADGEELILLINDELGDKAARFACRVVGDSGLELAATFTDDISEFCDTVKLKI